MRKSKFDEFVNSYDKETNGQYAYYYRSLWDACDYADRSYLKLKGRSVWETKEYTNWLRYFENYVSNHQENDTFRKDVCAQLGRWMEAI
ncbi:MAG: hypothetical protein RR448_04785 [Niameybacter sp.]|uniref:hypothetical protein n=1 Tax=Niameybacter sp. TaxID=2033640 RepID=UPI002FCC8FE6